MTERIPITMYANMSDADLTAMRDQNIRMAHGIGAPGGYLAGAGIVGFALSVGTAIEVLFRSSWFEAMLMIAGGSVAIWAFVADRNRPDYLEIAAHIDSELARRKSASIT